VLLLLLMMSMVRLSDSWQELLQSFCFGDERTAE